MFWGNNYAEMKITFVCNGLDEPWSAFIATRRNVLQVGDTLDCSADANPPATFQWTDLETGNVFNGSQLNISSTRPVQCYRCMATGQTTVVSSNICFNLTCEQFVLFMWKLIFSHLETFKMYDRRKSNYLYCRRKIKCFPKSLLIIFLYIYLL